MTYPSETIFDCLPGMVYISDNATKTIMWCNKGYSEKMIEDELQLCRGTVEYCLKECRIKWQVPNMQALIARAKSFGL